MKPVPLVVFAAALVVGAPAVLSLLVSRSCAHEDGHHEHVRATLGEIQQIADGELARGRRMEAMARDIARARESSGYYLALHAEAR